MFITADFRDRDGQKENQPMKSPSSLLPICIIYIHTYVVFLYVSICIMYIYIYIYIIISRLEARASPRDESD